MTHLEALEYLTKINAEPNGHHRWTLPVGTTRVHITYDEGARVEWQWVARPEDSEVDECFAPDPRQALLDLGAELSDMATHCSGMGLALTRVAV
jgi:hypothetical protein